MQRANLGKRTQIWALLAAHAGHAAPCPALTPLQHMPVLLRLIAVCFRSAGGCSAGMAG